MIPNDIAEFIKRKKLVGDWDVQADALANMLEYADEAQNRPPADDEPQIAAPVSALKRKPLVPSSEPSGAVAGAVLAPRQTVLEVDPVREYVRKRLSAEMVQPAAVNSELENRARMSGKLANVVNTALVGAGLQPTFKAFDYATPDLERRREAQEWVAKQQAAKDMFGLRALGAEGEAARGEYNQGELERRRAKDAADAKLAADRLDLARGQIAAKEKAGAAARGAKEREAVQKLEGAKISYFKDTYEPIAGTAPDSTIQNHAREFLSKSASAVTAIVKFRDQLKAAIATPLGPARRRALADVGTAATGLNTFLGQGAMAEPEFARIKDSLGQPGGIDYLVDVAKRFVSGDESELSNVLARTDETLALVRQITDEAIKPLGYRKVGQAQAAPSKLAPGRYKDKNTGKTIIVDENGNKRFE